MCWLPGVSSEDEQQGYVDIIKTNSDLLLRLINDILDVSRLEADRVTFTFEECDVVPLCQRVFGLPSVRLASQKMNLSLSVTVKAWICALTLSVCNRLS